MICSGGSWWWRFCRGNQRDLSSSTVTGSGGIAHPYNQHQHHLSANYSATSRHYQPQTHRNSAATAIFSSRNGQPSSNNGRDFYRQNGVICDSSRTRSATEQQRHHAYLQQLWKSTYL